MSKLSDNEISKKYKELCKAEDLASKKAANFHDKHYKIIHREQNRINGEKLQRLIKKHGDKIKVWCRNGEFSKIARPCTDVECRHKSDPSQVISGCSKCGDYQVTLNKGEWGNCPHISLEWGFTQRLWRLIRKL